MTLNPFKWLGKKVDAECETILKKADMDQGRLYKADWKDSKAWHWITQRTVSRSDGACIIDMTNSQIYQQLKYIDHLEERIAALEAKMQSEQQTETDEELFARFEAKIKEVHEERNSLIVYVGSRVWELLKSNADFIPIKSYYIGAYKTVVVYLLDEVLADHIK